MTSPRNTGMSRTGDTEQHRFTDGSTLDVRVDWDVEDAIDGLVHEWLHPAPQRDGHDVEAHEAHRQTANLPRFIRDSDQKILGVLVSEAEFREGRDAMHRINEDAYGSDATTYMPFIHAPNATTDRIINTDTLERVIKNARHGKDAEITREERDTIHYEALVAAIEFGFDADSRGLVPVMTPSRPADATWTEFHWSFLKPTPVPGLYLRIDDAIIAGVGYSLVSGSGFSLFRGMWEEDHANELAVKLAKALPGLNWFTVHSGAFTPELKKIAADVVREHGRFKPEVPTTPDLTERERAEVDRFGIHDQEGGL